MGNRKKVSSVLVVGSMIPRFRKLSLTFRKDSGGLPRISSTPSVPFGAADFKAYGSCRPPRRDADCRM